MSSFLPKNIQTGDLLNMGQAILILLVGAIVANILSRWLMRILASRLDSQQRSFFQPLAFYLMVSIFIFIALDRIGLRGEIVGALVGLLALGIGLAAKSPAANFMSGIFLLAERPFRIGDLIEMDRHTGFVSKIGLIATHLRTLDNALIRIPNEKLLTADLRNLTRFKIRRIEIPLELPPQTDWQALRASLMDIANRNPLCLEEPQPTFMFRGIHDGVVTVQWNIWCATDSLAALKTEIYEELTRVFAERGFLFVGPQRQVCDFSGPANLVQTTNP